MYIQRTDVLISSEITLNPVDDSKFIALSKLNAGLLMVLNIFLVNLMPAITAMKMTMLVKQKAANPSPAKKFDKTITPNSIGTVTNMKMKVSETGGLRIFDSIAIQPGCRFSQGLK